MGGLNKPLLSETLNRHNQLSLSETASGCYDGRGGIDITRSRHTVRCTQTVVLGLCGDVAEVSLLPGYEAVPPGNCFPAFRDKVEISIQTIKRSTLVDEFTTLCRNTGNHLLRDAASRLRRMGFPFISCSFTLYCFLCFLYMIFTSFFFIELHIFFTKSFRVTTGNIERNFCEFISVRRDAAWGT